MKKSLSQVLSEKFGCEVVFNGGAYEVYSPAGMFTLSSLQALSIIRQACESEVKANA